MLRITDIKLPLDHDDTALAEAIVAITPYERDVLDWIDREAIPVAMMAAMMMTSVAMSATAGSAP